MGCVHGNAPADCPDERCGAGIDNHVDRLASRLGDLWSAVAKLRAEVDAISGSGEPLLTEAELLQVRRTAQAWSESRTTSCWSRLSLQLLDEHAKLKSDLLMERAEAGRLERNAEACAYRAACEVVQKRLPGRLCGLRDQIVAEIMAMVRR